MTLSESRFPFFGIMRSGLRNGVARRLGLAKLVYAGGAQRCLLTPEGQAEANDMLADTDIDDGINEPELQNK